MSTAPFTLEDRGHATAVRGELSRRVSAPRSLGGMLLLLILYAAFEHGSVGTTREARVEVTIALIAALATGAGLWSGSLRLATSRRAAIGIALLAGFAAWSGVTLLWSVAPDQTWQFFNRSVTYVIVLLLAVALGSSLERPVELVARGFTLVAVVVTVYGLGQKILPGLHVNGVFDLNRTGLLPRLQEPLGYWNALALFVAMAVPGTLALAVDGGRTLRARVVSLVAIELMLLVIGFTYSRGGVLALAAGLAVSVALGGARLRALMWLGLVVLSALPPLLFGLIDHSLTSNQVGLGARELAGAELGVVLIVSTAGLALAARKLERYEDTVQISRTRARAIARLLIGLAVVLAICGLIGLTLSSRGLTGSISHAWKTFTTTHEASATNSSRLLTADSANRWVWWKEAAGAFSDRPVAGWGAGSFPVVHLLYRQDRLAVQQPHNVPLQFLAETGLIGAGLAIGAFALLLTAAAAGVRRRRIGSGRLLAASLLGGAVAYSVHAVYDWDWDIPAMTLPAMMFLGVLISRRLPSGQPAGSVTRAGAVAGVTILMCAVALSAALPSVALTDGNSALVAAANGSPSALQSAQGSASLASSLDPYSDLGLRVEATIADRLGQAGRARGYLLQALGRDPNDTQVWQNLMFVELALGDVHEAAAAARRMLALDPKRRTNVLLALPVLARETPAETPPADSGTAIQTPLG